MCGIGETNNGFFVTEQVNHHANITHNGKRLLFVPDSFIMGSTIGDSTLGKWIRFLETNGGPHFQNQTEFLGDSNRWFLKMLTEDSLVGINTTNNEAILIDNLMENVELNLNPRAYGIYIPADELLRRSKYEWYAVLSTEELLKSKPIITKYLIQSLYTTFMDDLTVDDKSSTSLFNIGSTSTENPKFIVPSQVGGGGI